MSLNVLVVDDSSVVRMMIAKTLKLTELPVEQIHQAANGREGLEVMNRESIDLLFVDINMPEMNGEERIQQVRAQLRGVRHAQRSDSTRGGLARGATDRNPSSYPVRSWSLRREYSGLKGGLLVRAGAIRYTHT